LVLLFGNAVIFSVFVALKVHWVLILFLVVFLVGSIFSLFSTTCTDPGIIPRGVDPAPRGFTGGYTFVAAEGAQPYPTDWKCSFCCTD
jgi:hypothetical protein